MVNEMTRLLTSEEVAERYRVTPSALWTQRHRGEAPGSLGMRLGRRLLWDPEDLRAYEQQRKEQQRETGETARAATTKEAARA